METHTLEKLDVCINEITQMQFCDEDGNDIIPLCTVGVCHMESLEEITQQPTEIEIPIGQHKQRGWKHGKKL